MASSDIKFKISKNSKGIFRVKMGKTWLKDEDLMLLIPGDFKSSVLNFTKLSDAYRAIANYLDKLDNLSLIKNQVNGFKENIEYPEDDFEEIE